VPQLQNKNPDRPGNSYKLETGLRERILQLNELDVKTYREGCIASTPSATK